ncbi:MAG: thioredoxin family protein [Candidatus Moranbacteria bacterium]|nr:thioredoxin family protein [Candidatus Moranbacteria bacterium]
MKRFLLGNTMYIGMGIVFVVLVVGVGLFLTMKRGGSSDSSGVVSESRSISSVDFETPSTYSDDSMSDSVDNKKDDVEIFSGDSSTDNANDLGGAVIFVGSGAYVDYDASIVSVAAAEGSAVLFFKADWCPSCRALDEDIIENLSLISDGMTIFKVNYDKEIELRQKYGITSQHSFVLVDAQGELLKKWIGSPTLESLMSQVEK